MKYAFPIFKNITKEEFKNMSLGRSMQERSYKKGATILRAGEVSHELGVVLSGSVNVENNDWWGNKSILNHIGQGQVFGEIYALSKDPLMVDAVAAEDCTVLFLDLRVFLCPGNVRQSWYLKFMQNLLTIAARKNLMLSRRIFCTTPKTIRARLITYFTSEAARAKGPVFDIPFDRQQLADYLNVDRSALSKELSLMQADGMIRYRKNHFQLLRLAE